MIAIRFISDRSFVSRAIGLRILGKPSHVEYVDGCVTFGARLEGGITYRPINYCNPAWEQWYTFPGIEASYREALAFAGRKYDWKDILELFIGWHPNYYDPHRAICSILVGYSNRIAWSKGLAPALVNPNLPTWQMTPETIYSCATQQIEKP